MIQQKFNIQKGWIAFQSVLCGGSC